MELATPRHPELLTAAQFGFGLNYTTFSITNLRLSAASVPTHGSISASVDVENTGTKTGTEVVQLYLHDPVASISQPFCRLRGSSG